MSIDPMKPEVTTTAPQPASTAHRIFTPTPLPPGAVEHVRLRPATAADAPALALIGAATFLEAFTWMLPGADIIAHCARHHTPEAYRHYLDHPDTRITLVTAGDDAPVGYSMLCTPELPTFDVLPTDIELKRIYLFSRFRSAPVEDAHSHIVDGLRPATAMLHAAIEQARDLDRTRLLLGTHASNERAIAFYRRTGFSEAGTRTFQVGTQLCHDLIFARQL
jgi:ribosomal protein S18 acetylase RimI-like enzyme